MAVGTSAAVETNSFALKSPTSPVECSTPSTVATDDERDDLRTPFSCRLNLPGISNTLCQASSCRRNSNSSLLMRRNKGGKVLHLDTLGSNSALDHEIVARYNLLQIIGSGSMAVVHRALSLEDGREVALKILKTKEPEMVMKARAEFEILKQLPSHPYIIRALAFYECSSGGAAMALELFEGVTLRDVIKHAPEKRVLSSKVADIGVALFKAVAHLHLHKVIHCDIKPSNVLVSPSLDDYRLADFNVAKDIQRYEFITAEGDFLFRAPEVVEGESCSQESDVWSTAACLLVALTGTLPKYQRDQQTDDRARKPALILKELSASRMRDSLCRALHFDPYGRPHAQELAVEAAWRHV